MSRRVYLDAEPGIHRREPQTGNVVVPIFLVGEVRFYREGLTRLLAEERSLQVVGSGPPDESSLRSIAHLRPRVVLIDSAIARHVVFVVRTVDASPGCAVIALGVRDDEKEVMGCAEAGVAGYVAATASASEVAQSLRTLLCGSFPCPSATASVLLRNVTAASLRPPREPDSNLTRRESDVLSLVDRGLSNKEIAAALSIELATVKNHVHNILGKLGVSRRGVAAARMRMLPRGHKDLDPGSNH
jgi:DNA-binding NarL/FixJ family response regulator